MLPIRLEIRNFLAYRAPDPVLFDGVHLACLTGSNGAGKSSLLDAITWVLWGKARAKRDEEMIYLGQTDMYVQLDFEQEGTTYRVLRQRTRKSGSVGALEFFSIGEEGELVALTEPNMRSTQARINRLLRLDYETFVHSAFLQQGRADAFTVKTPRDRKQILSDILGLSRWENYEELAKGELRAIDNDLRIYEADLQRIDADLKREPHLRASLEQAEAAQREAQAALEIAEKSAAEVAHARNDLYAAQRTQAEIDTRIRERGQELKTAEAEIERQGKRIAEYEGVIAQRGEIEQGYDALQAAREADLALGDLLMQLNQLDTEQRQHERDLDAARSELASELRSVETEIGALVETIDRARGDDLAEIQSEVASLQMLEDERDKLQAAIAELEQEKAGLAATNAALKTEMDAIKTRITRLGDVQGATCPLCGQPLDEDHRHELMAQAQAEGTERGDLWRANKTKLETLTQAITAKKGELAAAQETLRKMPALVEKVGELQAGVDNAASASARRAAVEARADGLRQMLANDDFAPDVRALLDDVAARRTALGYDSKRHTDARQDLETYRAYEARRTQLETALNALPDVQAALAGSHARRERLQTAIADEERARDQLLVEIVRLQVLAEEQQRREAEVLKQRQNERSATNKLGAAQQELRALDSLRERRIEVEEKQAQRRIDQAIYDELREAFGKKGIPAMIIETAIPELENGANRLLTRMTDGRMQLKMETQREKITGGVAETLDIQISDELGTRSYELYSGGEAFRINFAIRVALSQMLARRAGAHLRTLFIDEGFGTQDEDGRNKLVEAITAIQDDFDIILVVTHIDDLRDSFPVHLVVQKTGDGSYVSVR
jgi:DNA repair protein SbcC/Rad50